MRRASGQAITSSFAATRIGSPFKSGGPTVVKVMQRELLDSGAVVWASHKRSFDPPMR